jgi:hypothetical protein
MRTSNWKATQILRSAVHFFLHSREELNSSSRKPLESTGCSSVMKIRGTSSRGLVPASHHDRGGGHTRGQGTSSLKTSFATPQKPYGDRRRTVGRALPLPSTDAVSRVWKAWRTAHPRRRICPPAPSRLESPPHLLNIHSHPRSANLLILSIITAERWQPKWRARQGWERGSHGRSCKRLAGRGQTAPTEGDVIGRSGTFR